MMKALVLVFAISIAAPAYAAEAPAYLPQPDMVEQAISTHPQVVAAEAQLAAARAEARRRAVGEHDFLLSGSYVRRDTDLEGGFNEWDGTLSRAIRLPGKVKTDREIGALGVEVAENARDDVRHQVALMLKDYWLAWLEAAALAKIDMVELDSYDRELAAVERRLELKDAAPLDVQEVRAAQAQAQARALAGAAREQETARALRRAFPDLTLPAEAPDMPAPNAMTRAVQSWRDLILSRSHELRMAEQEASRQMRLAKRAKMDELPDPTLGVRLFSERGGAESGVGLVLSVPIGINRRAASSAYQRALAVSSAAAAQLARRTIEEVAERDIIQADAGYTVWRQARIAVETSAAMLSRLRRAVSLGERDLEELLRGLRRHYEVERAETAARVTAHNARLKLMIDAHEFWIVSHGHESGLNR